MNARVGVLGAGAWGVTIASMLSDKNYSVDIWEFNLKQAKSLSKSRKLDFFPYATLQENINVTDNLQSVAEKKDFLIFVLPSHALRKAAQQVASLNQDLSETIIVSATKGIENQALMRMSEILSVEINNIENNIVVLSGPSIAREVAFKNPTVVTAASANPKAAAAVQELFSTPYFRTYTHSDVVGVEAGGSLKNIFAIASGICDGLGFGDNTKSALVTRGLRELVQLGTMMGGNASTFFGLSGLGDLIVTCFSEHSRNRIMGEKIGKGESLDQATKDLIMVAEGVKTAKSAYKLGQKYKIELPIIEQVYQVLYYQKPPKQAIEELMMRKSKPETTLDIGGLTI